MTYIIGAGIALSLVALALLLYYFAAKNAEKLIRRYPGASDRLADIYRKSLEDE